MDFNEWEGDWITPEYDFQAPKTACPILRREFCLKGQIRQARAYVTAKGDYELYINGSKAGDAFLTPGWTSYNKRLLYQTYDVTDLLAQGENAVGAMIGSGWYKGELGWRSRRNLYGGREALILEIHVEYEDGTKEKILSDASWKSSYRGPVIYAEHYHGETYDARKETEFSRPGLDTGEWFGVRPMGRVTKSVLRAQECESVKIKEILKPVCILETPRGEKVLDMGQNMTGWVRFRVKGCTGSRVILSHAEMLEVRTPRGRVDVVMRSLSALYVMELKLDKTADDAMGQIDLKNYPERFALCGLPVVKVGINFDSERRTLGEWKIEMA